MDMGEIFDKLPNKVELEDYIRTYAGDHAVNSGRAPASLDYLMRAWEKNKGDHLFKLMGGQYIIEKKYSFNKDVSEITNEIRQSCRSGIMRDFYDNFCEYIQTRHQEAAPQDDDRETAWNEYKALSCLVEFHNLADSSVDFWYRAPSAVKVVINEDGDTVAIQKGAKPVRLLAKFAQVWGIEGFEAFRLELSRILNDKVLTGTMCLSIHPLDYITMSDNPYDWESCMNWMDGGQYRMGTVEMMNSPYVVVAYIKGDKPLRFYDHTWNGKKWRNLFIVDYDFITSIKGYPYQNREMDEFCIKWLKSLAAQNLDWHYETEIAEYNPDSNDDCVVFNSLEDGRIYFTFETGVMYNDFGNSNTSHMIIRRNFNKDSVYCYYSGETECMYCGRFLDNAQDNNDDIEETGYVICNECCKYVQCDCCGCSERSYDDLYELDGEYYCETCYNDHAVEDIMGETHNYDNCSKYSLFARHLEKGEVVDPDRAHYVWVYNYGDLAQYLAGEPIHHKYRKEDWYWESRFSYITPEELTEEGKQFFKENYYKFSDPAECQYLW